MKRPTPTPEHRAEDPGSSAAVHRSDTKELEASGEDDEVSGCDMAASCRVADELRLSEERYRRIVETTSDGVNTTDARGELTFVNQRFAQMLGYTRAELLGRPLFDFMAPEARANGVEKLRRRAEGLSETYEHSYQHKNGHQIRVLVTANPLLDANGKFEGTLGVIVDITDRYRADEMRDRLETIVESSDDAIFSTDLAGIITTWNGGAERLFGYRAEDIVGESDDVLIVPERAQEVARIRERVALGEWVKGTETTRRRKDGSPIHISLVVSPTRNGEGEIVGSIRIAHDLTERRKADSLLRRTEDQLRQKQKMEAIGSLAGGVAHDFNNILSIILSYTGLAISELEPGAPLRDDLLEVERAARRAEGLTRQLLAFSRQQVLAPQVLDLAQVVRGLESMLGRLLSEDIELALPEGRKVGRVFADRGQIEQVVMNLVVNARDAMPEGGKLVVDVADVPFPEAAQLGLPPRAYVLLSVTDSGTGMDEATAARVFEPFFTTKAQGKGTGLGLSTVFGIVQQSEGHVTVSSTLGAGTTFKVYLPRSARMTPAGFSIPPVESTLEGTETILLVEDDETVRNVARTILRKHGYDVLDATSGGDALLICELHAEPIHLMLTDVVMPRMNGPQLAQRLALVRPAMKVIFMSGYTQDAVIHRGVFEPGVAFLQKPITPDALARKVREVLDAIEGLP